ncbi:MAG: hypothetical protein Q8S94_00470 [Pseudohongiella sp.]|nr:hypothetical protein [Pseudohongiella sp.]
MLTKIEDIDVHKVALRRVCDEREEKASDEKLLAMKNLYQCAIREAENIKGSSNDIFKIAVSLRNLFEIYMISLHLVGSEDAVAQWYGQILKDVLDIQDGLIMLFSKHGIHSTDLNLARKHVVDSGARNNVLPAKPFNIKEIAKLYGWEEDYNAMYKLCSKIVHPSSVKVNLPGAFDKNDEYLRSLIHVAVHYLGLIAEASLHEGA